MRLKSLLLACLMPVLPASASAAVTFTTLATLNTSTLGYLATAPMAAGGSVFVSTYHANNGNGGDELLAIPATGGNPTSIGIAPSVTKNDREPIGQLLGDTSGSLYGMTPGAGPTTGTCTSLGLSGCGTLFKLLKSGTGYTYNTQTLASGSAIPQAPVGGLIADSAGNLYGVSSHGGGGTACPTEFASTGCGAVFKLSLSSGKWTVTELYGFKGGADGFSPNASLAFDTAGNLYGTTRAGGYLSNTGCNDSPFSGTNTSGPQTGCGTIYELSPPVSGTTWTKTTLYNFKDGTDGANPQSGVVFAGGALYGAAAEGGDSTNCGVGNNASGCGVIFKLTPPATGKTVWKESVLYQFPHTGTAAIPMGVLRDTKGVLVGVAAYSPSKCASHNCGEVFKLTKPATAGQPWVYTALHTFSGGLPDDGIPRASLTVDKNGVLYGVTTLNSTVFSVSGSGF
jgi:uncharacterized protein YceK